MAGSNFHGRPPLYLGYSELNLSALKVRIMSRIRSSLADATLAIAAASMLWAGQQHHRAAAAVGGTHQLSAFVTVDPA